MANKKKSDMVVKSNTLVKASYHLDLCEIRLLDMALAELSEYEEEEKHLTTLPDFIEIRADDYAELYSVTKQQAYTALREASERLFNRYFTYQVKAEHYPSFHEERKARWVGEIGYIKEHGVVTLCFTKALVELAGRFKIGVGGHTRYHVEQKAPLTSIYAHRLYEMLMSWRKSGDVPYITYYELRQRFEIDEEEYTRMSNFKSRVLNPSIKQINDLTDIEVSYTQNFKGRKIDGFTFKYKFKFKKTAKSKKSEEKRANEQYQPQQEQERKGLPKIPALSEKQINTFCFKIMKNFDFVRDYSVQTYGKSTDEVYAFIESMLRDDEQRQELARYLLLCGYELPKRVKKS